ncbi:MAG: isocitrate lyase/phosphoenolpyruvate mutase family protein [Proteobacteria bacterium]|nr:isocitrate lyase/phosphoenolpyruvate mutase family protein [Pseudomonadota bacterium]
MKNHQKFKNLHQQSSALHIGNAWNLQSALAFEKIGYQAIGTSSAAIASSLGYEDGEEMSFEELLNIVTMITKNISIPLTVDLEAGYGRNVKQIVDNISLLTEVGVVGVNLEDSIVDNGDRKIVDSIEFGKRIKSIKNSLDQKGTHVFLNARTDFYIMGMENPLKESILRAKLYEKSGADGIFIPCVTKASDIKKLVESVSIPINVLAMPELPVFSELEGLGVKRISSGSFVYSKVSEMFETLLQGIQTSHSFKPLF